MHCLFPLIRAPQEWLDVKGTVLLSWGVFNPNGPTLYCIGVRYTGARDETEVFYRWMHFLGGRDYCLGYLNERHGDWLGQFTEILQATLSPHDRDLADVVLFTCIPSVLHTLLPDELVPTIQKALAESVAISTANWGRERYLLDKYGADLFGRAGEEIRETFEQLRTDEELRNPSGREALELLFARHQHFPTFRDWSKKDIEARGIAEGDIETWWKIVQDSNYSAKATFQFAQAWVGASTHSGRLKVVTPLEEVRDFLIHFNHPWWPAEASAENLP